MANLTIPTSTEPLTLRGVTVRGLGHEVSPTSTNQSHPDYRQTFLLGPIGLRMQAAIRAAGWDLTPDEDGFRLGEPVNSGGEGEFRLVHVWANARPRASIEFDSPGDYAGILLRRAQQSRVDFSGVNTAGERVVLRAGSWERMTDRTDADVRLSDLMECGPWVDYTVGSYVNLSTTKTGMYACAVPDAAEQGWYRAARRASSSSSASRWEARKSTGGRQLDLIRALPGDADDPFHCDIPAQYRVRVTKHSEEDDTEGHEMLLFQIDEHLRLVSTLPNRKRWAGIQNFSYQRITSAELPCNRLYLHHGGDALFACVLSPRLIEVRQRKGKYNRDNEPQRWVVQQALVRSWSCADLEGRDQQAALPYIVGLPPEVTALIRATPGLPAVIHDVTVTVQQAKRMGYMTADARPHLPKQLPAMATRLEGVNGYERFYLRGAGKDWNNPHPFGFRCRLDHMSGFTTVQEFLQRVAKYAHSQWKGCYVPLGVGQTVQEGQVGKSTRNLEL